MDREKAMHVKPLGRFFLLSLCFGVGLSAQPRPFGIGLDFRLKKTPFSFFFEVAPAFNFDSQAVRRPGISLHLRDLRISVARAFCF